MEIGRLSPRCIRSLISVTFVLLLAVAIHIDWHMARKLDIRLSLGWPYHWLLGALLFVGAAWFVAARWPADAWSASALNLGLGAFVGQVLEPLGEVIYYGLPLARIWTAARWTAFAEFMAAGLMAYVVVMPMILGRLRPDGVPAGGSPVVRVSAIDGLSTPSSVKAGRDALSGRNGCR